METWDEMTERQKQERRAAVERLAQERLTQAEAASILKTTARNLNNYIQRHNIRWPNKRAYYRDV